MYLGAYCSLSCSGIRQKALIFSSLSTMAASSAAPFLLPSTILSPTMVPEEYRYPLAVVVSTDHCICLFNLSFCLGEAMSKRCSLSSYSTCRSVVIIQVLALVGMIVLFVSHNISTKNSSHKSVNFYEPQTPSRTPPRKQQEETLGTVTTPAGRRSARLARQRKEE
jgi:hypothetical protein